MTLLKCGLNKKVNHSSEAWIGERMEWNTIEMGDPSFMQVNVLEDWNFSFEESIK